MDALSLYVLNEKINNINNLFNNNLIVKELNAEKLKENGNYLENKYVKIENISTVATSGNYNDLINKPINIESANKLHTSRTINGTSFDGTKNIITNNWGTSRNITIGNSTKSINGSSNIIYTLNDIGVSDISRGLNVYEFNSATNTDNKVGHIIAYRNNDYIELVSNISEMKKHVSVYHSIFSNNASTLQGRTLNDIQNYNNLSNKPTKLSQFTNDIYSTYTKSKNIIGTHKNATDDNHGIITKNLIYLNNVEVVNGKDTVTSSHLIKGKGAIYTTSNENCDIIIAADNATTDSNGLFSKEDKKILDNLNSNTIFKNVSVNFIDYVKTNFPNATKENPIYFSWIRFAQFNPFSNDLGFNMDGTSSIFNVTLSNSGLDYIGIMFSFSGGDVLQFTKSNAEFSHALKNSLNILSCNSFNYKSIPIRLVEISNSEYAFEIGITKSYPSSLNFSYNFRIQCFGNLGIEIYSADQFKIIESNNKVSGVKVILQDSLNSLKCIQQAYNGYTRINSPYKQYTDVAIDIEEDSKNKDNSLVFGSLSIVNNVGSIVLGNYLQSYNDNQFICGSYNKYKDVSSNDIFVVGNGEYNNRSNALRLTNNGELNIAQNLSSNGADYAEYFEWLDSNELNEDRRGLFVTLDGEKIRLANSNDNYILGVISSNPSVVGDSQSEEWQGKYMTDVFNNRLVQNITIEEQIKNDKIIPTHIEKQYILNPNYDSSKPYIERKRRKEWDIVGFMGKLIVVDDGTCEINGYCYPYYNGIATKSDEKTKFRVINRIDNNHIKIVIT